MLKGGLQGRSNSGRRTTTRAVTGIAQNVNQPCAMGIGRGNAQTESLKTIGPARTERTGLLNFVFRYQNIAWQVCVFDAGEIIPSLSECAIKVFAARFVFDQQNAAPEQVDIAVFAVDFLNAFLETCHSFTRHAEDVEETVQEGFCFGVLRCFVDPFMGKS